MRGIFGKMAGLGNWKLYSLVGGIIIAVISTLYIQNKYLTVKMESMHKDVIFQKEKTKNIQKSLDILEKSSKLSNTLILKSIREKEKITERTNKVLSKLEELRRENKEAARWLNAAVPGSIIDLLRDNKDRDTNKNKKNKTPTTPNDPMPTEKRN